MKKMAKKMTSDNGSPRDLSEEGIKDLKNEIENKKENEEQGDGGGSQ